jgi:hypothetical protein
MAHILRMTYDLYRTLREATTCKSPFQPQLIEERNIGILAL